MLVLLRKGLAEALVTDVTTRLRMFGLAVHRTDHQGQVRLGAVGDGVPVDWDRIRGWPEVEAARRSRRRSAVSRAFRPQTP